MLLSLCLPSVASGTKFSCQKQFSLSPWTYRLPRWQAECAVIPEGGSPPCPAWDGGTSWRCSAARRRRGRLRCMRTLADFERYGIPKSVFLLLTWVVGFWRGRPWLARRWIGKKSLDVGSSRFWIDWVIKRRQMCPLYSIGADRPWRSQKHSTMAARLALAGICLSFAPLHLRAGVWDATLKLNHALPRAQADRLVGQAAMPCW